jgi:cadmium resistance protein CadD (predicted permease)
MLELLLGTVGAAVVLFSATNIDDLFILIGFFSDRRMKALDVAAGQALGIAALVLVSLAAAKLSLLLPMPLVGLLGFVPIALGIRHLARKEENDADEQAASDRVDRSSNWGQILAVAVVTIANGGDNIGVYTPVFATRSPAELGVMILVFGVMTVLWCLASHWLVNHRSVGNTVRRFGLLLLPYSLIAVGVWVLYEAESIALLR